MKQNDVFKSEYMKVADISGEGETFTIKSVQLEDFEDMDTKVVTKKPTITFNNSDKRFICNVTNWKRIVKQLGEESDGWIGKAVTLHLEEVEAFGKSSDAIRVKA